VKRKVLPTAPEQQPVLSQILHEFEPEEIAVEAPRAGEIGHLDSEMIEIGEVDHRALPAFAPHAA
jgi:hypothetical protein